MGLSNLDTQQIEGQLDLFEKEMPGDLFAVSRIFAAAKKQMTLAEYKALAFALSQVRWTQECPEKLMLDKKELAAAIGLSCDSSDLSQHLNRAIGEMPNHSFLRFADTDKGIYDNGNFIRRVTLFRNVCRILFEPEYLSLFGGLNRYITMWSSDIYKMHSERSVTFYELLRDNGDTRQEINICELGVKALKELFDIPKEGDGSYCDKNGHFARLHFERYVIDPICEDLKHCAMIQLITMPNGKSYEKIKNGNRVQGYRFAYRISERPHIATAKELGELNDEIKRDPELLKLAKNIKDGKTKSRKKVIEDNKSINKSDYDMNTLEDLLLEN